MPKTPAFVPAAPLPFLRCAAPPSLLRRAAPPSRLRRAAHAQLNGSDGLPNARDLASASPSSLRPGLLFRGATPAALPPDMAPAPDALRLLRSASLLLDLRSRDERASDQLGRVRAACGDDFDARERHVGLLNKRRVVWGLARVLPTEQARALAWRVLSNPGGARAGIVRRMDEGGLLLLNRVLVEAGAGAVGRALTALTDAARAGGGPVYFYCSAGKDRTGLLAALVLKVLGVPESQIVNDYAKSSECWENGPYELRANYCGKCLRSAVLHHFSVFFPLSCLSLLFLLSFARANRRGGSLLLAFFFNFFSLA